MKQDINNADAILPLRSHVKNYAKLRQSEIITPEPPKDFLLKNRQDAKIAKDQDR